MTRRYSIGKFRLDVHERRLNLGEQQIHLEPKAFDLLCHLVEHAGTLVGKDELVAAVWNNTIVSDNSITRCVHQVRAALADDVDLPRYIETIPGSGYRFIAEVSEIDASGSPIAAKARQAPHQRPFKLAIAVFAVLAAILLITRFLAEETPRSIALQYFRSRT